MHDGSENHQDAIVLDMELIQETKFTLPSYLQGRNTFVLHVNVTPVNDPPVLNLLPGKVLRLTQVSFTLLPKSRKKLLISYFLRECFLLHSNMHLFSNHVFEVVKILNYIYYLIKFYY